MFTEKLTWFLAFASPQVQPGQEPPPAWVHWVPLIFFAVFFYVLLIRPQQKKSKQHSQLLKQLKSGDKIVTNGGIVATVVSVKDKSLSIRSAESKLEVLKSSITEVLDRASS